MEKEEEFIRRRARNRKYLKFSVSSMLVFVATLAPMFVLNSRSRLVESSDWPEFRIVGQGFPFTFREHWYKDGTELGFQSNSLIGIKIDTANFCLNMLLAATCSLLIAFLFELYPLLRRALGRYRSHRREMRMLDELLKP